MSILPQPGILASRRRGAANAYAAAVLADSPLLYLRLEETTGASCANDGSLAGTATCTGTYTRNVASATANLGVAVTLSSFGGYINAGTNSAFNITGDVTYECWAKVPSFATYQTLIAKGIDTVGTGSRGYQFRIDQTTRNLTVVKTNTAVLLTSTTVFPNDGAWHHVAFTRSGNTYTIYLDGASAGTGTNTTTIDTNTSPLLIGAKPISSTPTFDEPLNGTVDEAAVYNTGLSSTRIAAHYAAR